MKVVFYEEYLTETQTELYIAIKEFIDGHGFGPTIRELCEILGKSSPGTIAPCLKILKRKGYIDYQPRRSRTLRITKELEYNKEN